MFTQRVTWSTKQTSVGPTGHVTKEENVETFHTIMCQLDQARLPYTYTPSVTNYL